MNRSHIIVGVAGHVDHGKTLLTTALTGVSTDRLPEEKKRGMTIVPGFVPLDLKSGRRLGLIDVPGHERFVKNMLAGVAGIDMALLVVAADEGVMPQTVEHLNILHLLGITRGVVAITKCDLAETDWLELVHEQVHELLASTALCDAPLINVSAHSGQNIDELKDLLDETAATVRERPATGLCRLPVDRVFSKQGFGTVVTGTLWAGRVESGQRLQLFPSGAELRVRGLQVHDQPAEVAHAGQRTALNLAGVEVARVTPGCWLAQPGLLRESHRLDIALTLLSNAHPIAQRARVRVFHGTREVLGRVRLLDRTSLDAGQSCLCQLELEAPLPPLRGDRLILRAYSPVITIAGATVLDTAPPRYRPSSPTTMATIGRKARLDTGETLLSFLEEQRTLLPLPALARTAQFTAEETAETVAALLETGQVGFLTMDGERQYYSTALEDRWRQSIRALLADYHKKYPLRRGIPTAELRQRLFSTLSVRQLGALLEHYANEHLIILSGTAVAGGDFTPTPTPRQQADLDGLLAPFLAAPFAPPEWEEVAAQLRITPVYAAEYLTFLLEHDCLTRVGDLFFSAQAVRDAETQLRAAFTTFTMAEARDLLGTSRKYVLALLESFDSRKYTVREGDSRRFL